MTYAVAYRRQMTETMAMRGKTILTRQPKPATPRPSGDVHFSDRQRRIHDFLVEHPVGVLASVNPDGHPHAAVIYHVVDDDFSVYFLTKVRTRKHANLTAHKQVMLTVFDASSQAVAQISGSAEELTDSYDVNEIAGRVLAACLRQGRRGLPPIAKLKAGPYTAFRIVPEQIKMAVYSRPGKDEYGEMFESLECFELFKDKG